MFYRRKLILALLEKLDECIEKNRVQELIFLLTNKQKNPDYEFFPYHFGCYSYSLSADLTRIIHTSLRLDILV